MRCTRTEISGGHDRRADQRGGAELHRLPEQELQPEGDRSPAGSTVVKIYYAREKYTITFHLMDGASADESAVTIGRYWRDGLRAEICPQRL